LNIENRISNEWMSTCWQLPVFPCEVTEMIHQRDHRHTPREDFQSWQLSYVMFYYVVDLRRRDNPWLLVDRVNAYVASIATSS